MDKKGIEDSGRVNRFLRQLIYNKYDDIKDFAEVVDTTAAYVEDVIHKKKVPVAKNRMKWAMILGVEEHDIWENVEEDKKRSVKIVRTFIGEVKVY